MDEVGSSIFKTIFTLGQMKIKIDSSNFLLGQKKIKPLLILQRYTKYSIHQKKIAFNPIILPLVDKILFNSYIFLQEEGRFPLL
jgi:hypothetical protein